MSLITKLLSLFKKYPSRFVEALVEDDRSNFTILTADKANILVQVVPDDCYFGLMYGLAKDAQKISGISVDLLVTRGINASIGRSITAALKRLNTLNYLYMKNWVKPFLNANTKVHWASQVSQLTKLQKSQRAYQLWSQWKKNSNNNNRYRVIYRDIRIDDLVIDTYLRYRGMSRFNINDIFVFILLRDALCQIEKLEALISKSDYKSYITSYASYTTHGIPVRVALKHELNVYSFGDLGSFGTKLSKDFPYHAFNPNVSENIRTYPNEKIKRIREEARSVLKFRFSGGVDPGISYMRRSSYRTSHKTNLDTNLKNKAILFLHDFVDSPNIYNNFIYDDFYQWTTNTIEILQAAEIPFAIKPHPNQVKESQAITEHLKRNYSDLHWISPTINNLDIIKSKPRVAVTVYGTVASELAYFGIQTICCSDHPHQLFKFCLTAQNRQSYTELLLGIAQIKNSPRQMVTLRNEALDYFAVRNGIDQQSDKILNDQYSKYWNTAKKQDESNTGVALNELNRLRKLPQYSKFIKGLTNEF